MFGLQAASSDDDEDTNQPSISASVPTVATPTVTTPTKKSRSLRIKYYEDPEKYVPEKIIGIAHVNGILLFHLQYQGSKCQGSKCQGSKCQGSKSEVVPSEILRYDHPEIVIQFYERRARMYENHIFRNPCYQRRINNDSFPSFTCSSITCLSKIEREREKRMSERGREREGERKRKMRGRK